MNNKRGWLRIAEAVIAIMILFSVLLVISSNQSSDEVDISEQISELQLSALQEISDNQELRQAALSGNIDHPTEMKTYEARLEEHARKFFPPEFEVKIKICTPDDYVCSLNTKISSDVFVEERIISSTLTLYNPRKVRLFVWN